MIQAFAVTITVVLVRFLLAGSAMDISHSSWVLAPGVLALALGAGLLSRGKLPYLVDSLAIALLVPARGWLCDASLVVLPPAWGGDVLAVVLSLGPIGFALGRQLSSLLQAGVLFPLLGWIVGELLVQLGIVGWCPGMITGFVAAALLAALVEMGTGRRTSYVNSGDEGISWEALSLGAVLALLLVVLRRVAPSYAAPGADVSSESLLALLVPAALVVAFAVMLTESTRARRVAFTLGSLGLAWACWRAVSILGLYTDNLQMIQLTRDFRTSENMGWPLVTEWHRWLLLFSALPAAGLGVALSSLRRLAAGPLALGVGLGLLAEGWVGHDPVWGPLHLLLLSAGLAGASCLWAWHRRGLLLLPLAALPFFLLPQQNWVGFDGVRRVGDFAADGWRRSLVADLSLFSTGSLDNLAVEGRREARRSFSDRLPFLAFADDGELLFKGESLEVEDLPSPYAPGFDPADDAPVKRYFGVRVAGLAMHANHDPMGPQGSLGRLHRLFAVPGPALVLGVGAELVAGDLLEAGLARGSGDAGEGSAVTVASRVPMGPLITGVLLEDLGTRGAINALREVSDDELRTLRDAPPGAFATVVLAPQRGLWPGTGTMLSRSVLARLADRLRPDGRLLAWVDTTDLDARALSARLAAFGEVFGSSSMALLELRELDAPLVLMVGWRGPAGRPTTAAFGVRCGAADRTGFRSRLVDLDDLAAMLLFDGDGLVGLARAGPLHDRGRPVSSGVTGHGAAAVAGVYEPGARLAQVLGGGPEKLYDHTALLAGMARHSSYFYDLERLRGAMMVEPLADVEWAAFEDEVAAYVEAAAVDGTNPLLHLAVAALLEPLAREDNLTRFAESFLAIDCEQMDSWRLALLHHYVAKAALEPELAEAALSRARSLAPDLPAGSPGG